VVGRFLLMSGLGPGFPARPPPTQIRLWMGATENVGFNAKVQRNRGLDFVTKQHKSLQKLQTVYSLV